MKKIVIMVLATALLSSCGLYNKYERPEVNTKGLVRDAVSLTDTLAVKDTTSFGNMPWRSVFTDPQLQSLIERGLANNPDLLNAALNVKMVNEALKVAKLAFIPSLSFTPQGTIASFDGAPATKSYSLPVTASWNVDLFGNLLNQKRSAQMQLLATQDYQTVVQTNIISGIANLYYTLLMLDRQMEIINGMTSLTKDTWDMMKLQMNLGRARSTSGEPAVAAHRTARTGHRPWQAREPEPAHQTLHWCRHPAAQQPRRCPCRRDVAGTVLLRRADSPQPLLS